MGNFTQNNYTCELGLAGRIGICQEGIVILKEALDLGFINQKQKHCMERIKHFLNLEDFGESSNPLIMESTFPSVLLTTDVK